MHVSLPGSTLQFACLTPRLQSPVCMSHSQAPIPSLHVSLPGSNPQFACLTLRLQSPVCMSHSQAPIPSLHVSLPGSNPQFACLTPRLQSPVCMSHSQAPIPSLRVSLPGSNPQFACLTPRLQSPVCMSHSQAPLSSLPCSYVCMKNWNAAIFLCFSPKHPKAKCFKLCNLLLLLYALILNTTCSSAQVIRLLNAASAQPYTAKEVKNWKFITVDLKGPFHGRHSQLSLGYILSSVCIGNLPACKP